MRYKTTIKYKVLLSFFAIAMLSGCANTKIDKAKETTSSEANLGVPKNNLEKLQQNIMAFDSSPVLESELSKVVELDENSSFYYIGKDGKRYIFTTPETYNSWFKGKTEVKKLTLEQIQKIELGGNITVRPGNLITTSTAPGAYLVQKGGTISFVEEKVLKQIFGSNFSSRVINLPNYYFTNYKYIDPIESVEDYPLIDITLTIDQDKGLDELQK